MSRGLFIFFALLWASFFAPQNGAAVIALPAAKLHPWAHNLHVRTNGGLSQIFTTDPANELTNVTRNGAFTLIGATPAPATNITVNGKTAQIYGDFTFACPNLTLADGANMLTNIAVNVYGTKVTNIVTVNLPQKTTLGFDSNGNITNDGALSFAYDYENQLTNVVAPNQWRSDFIYDGLSRRRIERDYVWTNSAWSKTSEVHYIYDGYLLVQERDASNNVMVTYTRGLDMSSSIQGASGIGGLLARTDSNSTTYYHADGNGNITALMDGMENIVARYLYGPFGKVVGKWGTLADANEMRFSSMPYYSNPQIYGYWGRFYDPNLQRWLNHDPIGERGGINLFGFVGNNPVNYVDLFGLRPGDRYPTADAAGIQAIKDIIDTSIQMDREYAGLLYKNPDGSYSYTEPRIGPQSFGGDKFSQVHDEDCPKKSKPAGIYHTHGAPSQDSTGGRRFSDQDKDSADGRQMPNYLGNVDKDILRYDPDPNQQRKGSITKLIDGLSY
jgi:RHS repeat-associated protein